MKAISFVGNSGSGKTRLLARLIPELKKRGHTVAVVKHCPHGFSLDPRRKDSRRFFEAGADGVALVSSEATAVIKRNGLPTDFSTLARSHFEDIDILLVEGGRAKKDFKKIEVLGKNDRPGRMIPAGELIAVVSDQGEGGVRPIFRHSQVKEIAGFLESQPEWPSDRRPHGGKRRKKR
ncbi:MAG TPA: molybdopterin-guanine dinucleotide biosynthesis protein B [Candidatus Aminicenantes bacterium]|jgi:molybdopterin-guanine dinucleotide biosynthesis protein B|nr:molybdopterin-guanine dinucleotide biosynthesis protein B [Candidatus Aminicenantes bacterium]